MQLLYGENYCKTQCNHKCHQFNCPPLNENSTIFIRDEDPLPERSRNLKTGIWCVTEDARAHKKTVNTIEIIKNNIFKYCNQKN